MDEGRESFRPWEQGMRRTRRKKALGTDPKGSRCQPHPLSGGGSRAPVVESLHPKSKQKGEQHPKPLSTSY